MKINRDKIEKFQLLTFQNSIRLYFDAIKLFRLKSYPSAYYLSTIALEELGKTVMIDNLLWYAFTERHETALLQKYLETMYLHKSKQIHSVRDEFPKYRKLLEKIEEGQIDIEKQNSLYVGLTKRSIKGKILTN